MSHIRMDNGTSWISVNEYIHVMDTGYESYDGYGY